MNDYEQTAGSEGSGTVAAGRGEVSRRGLMQAAGVTAGAAVAIATFQSVPAEAAAAPVGAVAALAVAPSPAGLTVSAGPFLTTNRGLRIADHQNSERAGLRGPTLLEDFHLREKIANQGADV